MARLLPLIILLSLNCIGFGIICAKHGKPKRDKYNGWTTLISIILEWGLILWAIL